MSFCGQTHQAHAASLSGALKPEMEIEAEGVSSVLCKTEVRDRPEGGCMTGHHSPKANFVQYSAQQKQANKTS